MTIKIGNFDCTEVWDGVFYKKLSNYPQVSDWEIRTIIEFIEYEKSHGRKCNIECDDKNTLQTILDSILHKEKYLSAPRPKLLTEVPLVLTEKVALQIMYATQLHLKMP